MSNILYKQSPKPGYVSLYIQALPIDTTHPIYIVNKYPEIEEAFPKPRNPNMTTTEMSCILCDRGISLNVNDKEMDVVVAR